MAAQYALIPSSHRHLLPKIVRTERPHPRHDKKLLRVPANDFVNGTFRRKRRRSFPSALMLQLVDATLSSGSTDMAFS